MEIELNVVLTDPKFRLKIEDADFGGGTLEARIKLILKKNDIVYVAELIQLSAAELKRYPHFGQTCLDEINKFLTSIDLELGSTIEGYPENKYLRVVFEPEQEKASDPLLQTAQQKIALRKNKAPTPRSQVYFTWCLVGSPESDFQRREIRSITIAGKILAGNAAHQGGQKQIDLQAPLEIYIGRPLMDRPRDGKIPYIIDPDMISIGGKGSFRLFLGAHIHKFEILPNGTKVLIDTITHVQFADGENVDTKNFAEIDMRLRQMKRATLPEPKIPSTHPSKLRAEGSPAL